MAKKRMIVEIEYPDGKDLCWDSSISGAQTFHDCIVSNAVYGNNRFMLDAITAYKDKHGNCEGLESDQYYKFVSIANEVICSAKNIGYIDDDGIALFYDLQSDEYVETPIIEN